jgi:hypothetical protein
MEVAADHLIVMTPDGKFVKIPRGGRSCQIGEEIGFASPGYRPAKRPIAVSSSLVAAALICLVVFYGWTGAANKNKVIAYISMDINPSVEMGIDAARNVQELRGLNAEGARLVERVDYKNKPIDEVTGGLIALAEEQGYFSQGEAEIVIAGTLVEQAAAIDETALVEQVKQRVEESIQQTNAGQTAEYQVTALVAPVEVREKAEKSGISTGKYAIYLGAKNNGHAISIDEFKNDSIRNISKEAGGLANMLGTDKPVTKSDWKKLLKEEEEGLLDRKATGLAKRDNASGADKDVDGKRTNADSKNDNKNANNKNADSKNGNKNDSNRKNDNNKKGDTDNRNGGTDNRGYGMSGNSSINIPGMPAFGMWNSLFRNQFGGDDKRTTPVTGGGKKEDDKRTTPTPGNGKKDDGKPTAPAAGDWRREDDKRTTPTPGNGKKDDGKPTAPAAGDWRREDDKQKTPPTPGNGKKDDGKPTAPATGGNQREDDKQKTPPTPGNGKKDDDKPTAPATGGSQREDDKQKTPPTTDNGKKDDGKPTAPATGGSRKEDDKQRTPPTTGGRQKAEDKRTTPTTGGEKEGDKQTTPASDNVQKEDGKRIGK